MIISASRRTDIPAFYGDWFLQRLRDGVVLVRNPMNFHQVSEIALAPENTLCIVFWTKNPTPMLTKLAEIEALGYRYYFLFTLTAYDRSIEPQVPAVAERIAAFRTLARKIGKERVIWRYDPILCTDRYSPAFHAASFAAIAGDLAGCTARCIVSFVEMYRKCVRNMQGLAMQALPVAERIKLLGQLQAIAAANDITLQTCAAAGDLEMAGLPAGSCIDRELVARISGTEVDACKDKNQRRRCGCVESIDIGAYNSCLHGCRYCYANSDRKSVVKNFAAHNAASPLLYGVLDDKTRVTARRSRPLPRRQRRLF